MSDEVRAIEALFGRDGDPLKCVEHGEIQMHWWPTGAKPGDRCLCGKRVKQVETVDGESDGY